MLSFVCVPFSLKNTEKRERKTRNKKQLNNNNSFFFTCSFLYRKIYILLENLSGKAQFILLRLQYSFINGFLFFLYISERYLHFRREIKAFVKEVFRSPDTSNRIYLLRNCFQTIYISKICTYPLKELENFRSVLIILLICKFLNFTAVFVKKKQSKTFQSFYTTFRVRKLIKI